MKIAYHRQFLKHYQKRILPNPALVTKFNSRLSLLLANPTNPLLKLHKLQGSKSSYQAFSITGDFRVIFKIVGETLRLYDIGTHNQVY